MKFARWVFRLAGIYGLLIFAPQYFMEDRISVDYPPALNHPEYFYGFVGLGIVWQVAFLLISTDPVRYRPWMLVGVLEKLSFGGAAIPLYVSGRIPTTIFAFAIVDLTLGGLFIAAFLRTPPAAAKSYRP